VIIGHGLVGARFAEEVRRHDPAGERVALTVFGEPTEGSVGSAATADRGEGAA
jgi:assimilatory nitrate reductase electron transfer subunit